MIEVIIDKPLYKTFCYVRDVYLKKAIANGEMIKITIPDGSVIVDPKEWIRTGKKMEKVFKRPNEPMILYGNHVQLQDKDQLDLFK